MKIRVEVEVPDTQGCNTCRYHGTHWEYPQRWCELFPEIYKTDDFKLAACRAAEVAPTGEGE